MIKTHIVDPDEFKKWIEEKLAKKQRHDAWIIEEYFPLHIGHTQTEGEFRYMDAMFMAKQLHCSCKQVLLVNRDMIESAQNVVR